MNKRGFTLIEMLVALSIFSIVITIVMQTFVHSFNAQRKVIEMQVVQREGAYLMESLSREIRMATDIEDSQRPSSGSSVTFENHNKKTVTYCRSNSNGNCSASDVPCNVSTGDHCYLGFDMGAANRGIMNSSEVRITDLKFYVSPKFGTKSQPFITIYMTLQSVKDPDVNVTMQTSVAMRLYS